MKYEPKIEKEIMCPIEYGLDIFGGKWKSRIICVLSSQDAMRYSEVRKELMEDRIISRTQYNEIPPRVEYSLTDQGRSALPILQSICAWSRQHTPESLEKKLPPCQTCPQL